MAHLLDRRVESVADLGCGGGALLERLIEVPHIRRIVGVDSSPRALLAAGNRLAPNGATLDPRVVLVHSSITEVSRELGDIDAAVLVEMIEHVEPTRLGALERAVFARLQPRLVLITTPNREYNPLHGVPPDRYRHPDHQFEWDRRKFESWAAGIGRRHGYDVVFEGVGPASAWFGSSSQMAVFTKTQR